MPLAKGGDLSDSFHGGVDLVDAPLRGFPLARQVEGPGLSQDGGAVLDDVDLRHLPAERTRPNSPPSAVSPGILLHSQSTRTRPVRVGVSEGPDTAGRASPARSMAVYQPQPMWC